MHNERHLVPLCLLGFVFDRIILVQKYRWEESRRLIKDELKADGGNRWGKYIVFLDLNHKANHKEMDILGVMLL